ncbi:MAG: L-seryl-tRNA(Sec) selenium transferase [Thermoleophilaceae bacterium]
MAVRAARAAIDARREAIRSGGPRAGELRADAEARAAALLEPSLQRVLNATGVIVHTNLGRARLAPDAVEAVRATAASYTNLELDPGSRGRGSRQAHVEELLLELSGAEAALVVNNCAAAVLLAAAALAAGAELIVSRGQLVEIGGSFRIPEIVAQSGARLVEVGTTNRTRIADYENAIGPRTAAILRAHPSNFRTLGFVEDVDVEELCAAARAREVPVIDDVGSGVLRAGIPELADEPSVRRSVDAGCAIVCFSGDKLLGGPQAGLLVGRAHAIEQCRTHPLARAVRIDKLSLAALEATLRLHRDAAEARARVPVLRMLSAGEGELRDRAERICSQLRDSKLSAEVIVASARVGGGALPLLELPGPVCAVDPGALGADEMARRLRLGRPPVIARLREGWVLLDPRTIADAEVDELARAVAAALG